MTSLISKTIGIELLKLSVYALLSVGTSGLFSDLVKEKTDLTPVPKAKFEKIFSTKKLNSAKV